MGDRALPFRLAHRGGLPVSDVAGVDRDHKPAWLVQATPEGTACVAGCFGPARSGRLVRAGWFGPSAAGSLPTPSSRRAARCGQGRFVTFFSRWLTEVRGTSGEAPEVAGNSRGGGRPQPPVSARAVLFRCEKVRFGCEKVPVFRTNISMQNENGTSGAR